MKFFILRGNMRAWVDYNQAKTTSQFVIEARLL